MQQGDEVQFAALMTDVFDAYGKSVGRAQVELYFNVLVDYPFSSVAEAMYQHMADPDRGQFAPKPADVVRHLQGGRGTRALAAWDEALQAVRAIGYYGSVTFDDPLILACIDRMGGWMHFCTMTEDDRPFRQREFIERYSGYVTAPPADIPKSLPGFYEQTNRMSQWANDPRALEAGRPQRVGDPKPPVLPAEEPKALPHANGSKPRPIGSMSTLGGALKAAKPALVTVTPEERAEAERRKAAMKARAEVGR